jgi:hypothetical protein
VTGTVQLSASTGTVPTAFEDPTGEHGDMAGISAGCVHHEFLVAWAITAYEFGPLQLFHSSNSPHVCPIFALPIFNNLVSPVLVFTGIFLLGEIRFSHNPGFLLIRVVICRLDHEKRVPTHSSACCHHNMLQQQ